MKTPKNRKKYASPAVGTVMQVLEEAALLSASALVGRQIMIIGHDINDFYTNDDLQNSWD